MCARLLQKKEKITTHTLLLPKYTPTLCIQITEPEDDSLSLLITSRALVTRLLHYNFLQVQKYPGELGAYLHFYIHTQQPSPSSQGQKVCREVTSWDLFGFSFSSFPHPRWNLSASCVMLGYRFCFVASQIWGPGATEHSHVNASNSQGKSASGKLLFESG